MASIDPIAKDNQEFYSRLSLAIQNMANQGIAFELPLVVIDHVANKSQNLGCVMNMIRKCATKGIDERLELLKVTEVFTMVEERGRDVEKSEWFIVLRCSSTDANHAVYHHLNQRVEHKTRMSAYVFDVERCMYPNKTCSFTPIDAAKLRQECGPIKKIRHPNLIDVSEGYRADHIPRVRTKKKVKKSSSTSITSSNAQLNMQQLHRLAKDRRDSESSAFKTIAERIEDQILKSSPTPKQPPGYSVEKGYTDQKNSDRRLVIYQQPSTTNLPLFKNTISSINDEPRTIKKSSVFDRLGDTRNNRRTVYLTTTAKTAHSRFQEMAEKARKEDQSEKYHHRLSYDQREQYASYNKDIRTNNNSNTRSYVEERTTCKRAMVEEETSRKRHHYEDKQERDDHSYYRISDKRNEYGQQERTRVNSKQQEKTREDDQPSNTNRENNTVQQHRPASPSNKLAPNDPRNKRTSGKQHEKAKDKILDTTNRIPEAKSFEILDEIQNFLKIIKTTVSITTKAENQEPQTRGEPTDLLLEKKGSKSTNKEIPANTKSVEAPTSIKFFETSINIESQTHVESSDSSLEKGPEETKSETSLADTQNNKATDDEIRAEPSMKIELQTRGESTDLLLEEEAGETRLENNIEIVRERTQVSELQTRGESNDLLLEEGVEETRLEYCIEIDRERTVVSELQTRGESNDLLLEEEAGETRLENNIEIVRERTQVSELQTRGESNDLLLEEGVEETRLEYCIEIDRERTVVSELQTRGESNDLLLEEEADETRLANNIEIVLERTVVSELQTRGESTDLLLEEETKSKIDKSNRDDDCFDMVEDLSKKHEPITTIDEDSLQDVIIYEVVTEYRGTVDQIEQLSMTNIEVCQQEINNYVLYQSQRTLNESNVCKETTDMPFDSSLIRSYLPQNSLEDEELRPIAIIEVDSTQRWGKLPLQTAIIINQWHDDFMSQDSTRYDADQLTSSKELGMVYKTPELQCKSLQSNKLNELLTKYINSPRLTAPPVAHPLKEQEQVKKEKEERQKSGTQRRPKNSQRNKGQRGDSSQNRKRRK